MFSLPRLFGKSSSAQSNEPRVIDIPAVPVQDIDKLTDKNSRAAKHLIRVNHKTHSLTYNDSQSQNELLPLLGSAYLLGADDEQLLVIYDHHSKPLEEWQDSPSEVGGPDWYTFMGKREYQRAFIDFFEDQLVNHDFNWKEIAQAFLYEKTHALFGGLTSDVGNPLVYLAYAYELNNREAAIEALAQLACNYDFTFDDGLVGTDQPIQQSTSPRALLKLMTLDRRLSGLFTKPEEQNISVLMEQKKAELVDHVRALTWDNPQEQLKDCYRIAVSLLLNTGQSFSILFSKVLISLHATRVLLPIVPASKQIALVQQWWYLVIKIYAAQLRPEIRTGAIDSTDIKGRDWKYIVGLATSGKYALDASYVQDAAALYNDDWYLKAAVHFTDGFNGWH